MVLFQRKLCCSTQKNLAQVDQEAFDLFNFLKILSNFETFGRQTSRGESQCMTHLI
jgi:hypothetical protein